MKYSDNNSLPFDAHQLELMNRRILANGTVAELLVNDLTNPKVCITFMRQLRKWGFLHTALIILKIESNHCTQLGDHTLKKIQCLLFLATNVVMTMPERAKWVNSEQALQFQPVIRKLCSTIPGLTAPPALLHVRVLFGVD